MGQVHRGPAINEIFTKLTNTKYLTFIEASSGYHNLEIDETLSFLTTFLCQYDRYRYMWLLFEAAPAVEIFKRIIDQILKELPNILNIKDYILIVRATTAPGQIITEHYTECSRHA